MQARRTATAGKSEEATRQPSSRSHTPATLAIGPSFAASSGTTISARTPTSGRSSAPFRLRREIQAEERADSTRADHMLGEGDSKVGCRVFLREGLRLREEARQVGRVARASKRRRRRAGDVESRGTEGRRRASRYGSQNGPWPVDHRRLRFAAMSVISGRCCRVCIVSCEDGCLIPKIRRVQPSRPLE